MYRKEDIAKSVVLKLSSCRKLIMLFVHILFVFITAVRAMELLNFTPLNGKPIRIAKSLRDPTVRKSGSGNIFIKVLLPCFRTTDLYFSSLLLFSLPSF